MNHLEKAKELHLPYEDFVLVGGSVLDIHGIRKSDDMDVVVSARAFRELKDRGWEIDQEFLKKWGRERLVHDVFEVYQNLIHQSLNYYIPFEVFKEIAHKVQGIQVQPLGFLLLAKIDNGREKDLADVELIKKFLKIP